MANVVSPTKISPAALEFYKAARTELVERVKLRDQVLLVYLAFVGAVSGAALSLNNSREISLVLPFLGMGCAILVSQHNSVIGALIRYTSIDLHKHLVQGNFIPEFVNSSSFRSHSPRSNFFRSAGHAVVILIPEVTGLGINFEHAISSPFPFGPAWWFGLACILISSLIIWSAHSGRQKVYNETPWAYMNRRYFFLRHGRSQANEAGTIASRISEGRIDPSLTDEGRRQIIQSTLKFKSMYEFRAVEIVASPFKRTTETAALAGEILGCNFNVDWRLRERDFGIFDGMGDENYRIVWDADRKGRRSDEYLVEPISNVILRVESLLEDLEKSFTENPVLLCSHGDVISISLTHFSNKDIRDHRNFASLNTGDIRELVFSS